LPKHVHVELGTKMHVRTLTLKHYINSSDNNVGAYLVLDNTEGPPEPPKKPPQTQDKKPPTTLVRAPAPQEEASSMPTPVCATRSPSSTRRSNTPRQYRRTQDANAHSPRHQAQHRSNSKPPRHNVRAKQEPPPPNKPSPQHRRTVLDTEGPYKKPPPT
jgi:hypothetical protein